MLQPISISNIQKTFLLLLIVGLVCSSCDDLDISPDRRHSFELQSGESTYEIEVALPEDYQSSSKEFATIYVLDGEDDFGRSTTFTSEISDEMNTDNIIVVAIMNYGKEGRTYAYTPTDGKVNGGGAGEFLTFITGELIPEIESRFRASSLRKDRIFMGHSYGGLCAAQAFSEFNQYFENYLMLSASLIFDDHVMFTRKETNRQENSTRRNLIYMGYGEMEYLVIHLPNKAFYKRLNEFYPLNVQMIEEIDGEAHNSVKDKSVRKGLKFYFQNRN